MRSQCERKLKCTREWKVTGQTSSLADAVPLACCKINFAMRAQNDRIRNRKECNQN